MVLRMKRNFSTVAVLLSAAVMLLSVVGCSLTPWGVAKRNIENSRELRVGMTKGEVLEIMGEPIRNERFCNPNLWYYYIEMVWGDGLITEEECMPLVFEGGKLIGWGNDFYIDYRVKHKEGPPVLNPEHEPKEESPFPGASPTGPNSVDKTKPAAPASRK